MRGLSGAGCLRVARRLGTFLRRQTSDGQQQRVERGPGVGAFRREAELGAGRQPQLQQRHEILGIGGFVAMADLHPRGKATRGFDPLRGRAGVQATRVFQRQGALLGEVGARSVGGGRGCVAGECGDKLFSILRGEELPQTRIVIQQPCQPAQQRDVLVRLRGDGKYQVRRLARVPLQPVRKLQHRNARLADQVAVLAHAVRNGDAVAEKRVGHGFAAQEAVDIGGIDAAGVGQQLAGSADGAFLVGGALLQTDAFGADQGGSHAAGVSCGCRARRPGMRVVNDRELKSITVRVSMCGATQSDVCPSI